MRVYGLALVLASTACGRYGFEPVVADDGALDAAATDACVAGCQPSIAFVFPLGGERLFWTEFRLEWESQGVTGPVRLTRSIDGLVFDDDVILDNTGTASDPYSTASTGLEHFLRLEAVSNPATAATTTARVFVESD